jgi:hypothetical protein
MSTKKMVIQQSVHLEEENSDDDSMSDASTTDHSLRDAASTPSSEEGIAENETKAVNLSKMLVYKILLITGAALGTGMYFFLSGSEQDDFESQVRYVFPRSSIV